MVFTSDKARQCDSINNFKTVINTFLFNKAFRDTIYIYIYIYKNGVRVYLGMKCLTLW